MSKQKRWKKLLFTIFPIVATTWFLSAAIGFGSGQNHQTNQIHTNQSKQSKKVLSEPRTTKEFKVADLRTTNLDTGWKNIPFNESTVQFQLRPEANAAASHFRNTNLINSNGTTINIDFRQNDQLPYYQNDGRLLYTQWAGAGVDIPKSFVTNITPNLNLTFTDNSELVNLNGVGVQYLSEGSITQQELISRFNFVTASNSDINYGGVTPSINTSALTQFDTSNGPVVVNTAITLPSQQLGGNKLFNVNANQVVDSSKYGYFQKDFAGCMNFFSSQLYDVIHDTDSTSTTGLYFYEPTTSSAGLDKTSDILLPNNINDFWKGTKNLLPSQAIANLTAENISSMLNEFKTVFFTESMLKNFSIEFTPDDATGTMNLKITLPYQIRVREQRTYLQLASNQPNKQFINNVYVIDIVNEPVEKTFLSNDFYRSDMTTNVIAGISMLSDQQLGNYSVKEILALNNAQEKLKLFVMRHKDEVFDCLPDDFSIENIVTVNLEENSTDTSQATMLVTLDSYFFDGLIPDENKVFSITLTDVYQGATAAITGEVEIDGFSDFYAQTSILKSNDETKPGILNPEWAKTNGDNLTSHTIDGNELTNQFKHQLLEKCISGKKDGITINDIDRIAIDWFNNSDGTPSICVSMIVLKKYYSNEHRNIINTTKTLLNDDEKIIITGFKQMDIEPITLNEEFCISGVDDQYPDQVNKSMLMSKLNENLFNTIYSPNTTLNQLNVSDLNFSVNNNFKIGQVTNIASEISDRVEGTKTLNGITASNVFIQQPDTQQIVFASEYTFPSQQLIATGFKATKNETQIIIPEGIEWGVVASDVRDNLNNAREIFIQKFFDECVRNPQNVTAADLSVTVNSVDNTRGYMEATITLNGNPPIVKENIRLYGFIRQEQTTFKQYNGLLPAPEPTINLYDFTIADAIDIIDENIDLLVNGIPDGFTKEDIYIAENDFVPDYRDRTVQIQFKLRKYNNDRGELVEGEALESLPTSYVYRIGLFNVNQPTTNFYDFTYTINDPQYPLTRQCYIDPDSFIWLKDYVLQALLAESEIGRLSIPEITTSNFLIVLNSDWIEYTNPNAYALGEIYLDVSLYKYYDYDGRLIDIDINNNLEDLQPLQIKVKLKGWEVWTTSFLLSQQAEVNWGNGEVNPTDDQIKNILWNHRDELAKCYPYNGNSEQSQFVNNIDIQTRRQVNGSSLSVEVTIRFKEYFVNGRLINDEQSPQRKIIITNFATTNMTTTFTTLQRINTDETAPDFVNMDDIYPSDLAACDINAIPLKFKQLVFDKIITGDKFDMTINNIKNIRFEDSSYSNVNGTIEIAEIEIMGYEDSTTPDHLITKEFLPRIRVGGLRKTTATALKSDSIVFENNTAYTNLFNLNGDQLKLIVQRNIDKIFKQPLPEGTASIKSVEQIAGSQQWLAGTVKIKITVSSFYNSAGIREEGEKTFPENSAQSITITNFSEPKPTQMPTINFDASEAFMDDNGNIYPTTIFAEDVIDQNWEWIKEHLIKAINEAFSQFPDKFISVSIRNPADFNQIAWSGGAINWNFLSPDFEQSVKDSFALAAKKAKDNPSNYNNDSYGRIELKVLMLRGIVKTRYGELLDNQPLSEQNATLTLRLSGFATSNHYEQQNWYSNNSMWATVVVSIGVALFLITMVAMTIVILKRKRNSL